MEYNTTIHCITLYSIVITQLNTRHLTATADLYALGCSCSCGSLFEHRGTTISLHHAFSSLCSCTVVLKGAERCCKKRSRRQQSSTALEISCTFSPVYSTV